jgi:hypothetical protein
MLRLEHWIGGRPLRLVVADLIRGEVVEQVVDVDGVLPDLRDWLVERVERIRERIQEPRAVSGVECGWCPFIAGCSAHSGR